MCILLCLSDTRLLFAILCKEFTKCIGDLFFYECDLFILDRSVIFCEAYKCCLDPVSSFKSVKAVVTEGSCELSCSVRAEVEEYYRIIFFDCCNWCISIAYYSWLYKFIKNFFLVWCLYCLYCRWSLVSNSINHCIISLLNSLPSLISIHCIESSRYTCNFAYSFFFHFFF